MSLMKFARSRLWRTPSFFKIKEKKEKPMFDKIFAALKQECGLNHMTSLMNALNQVAAHFGDEYVKDQNARNAAIDAVKDVLEGLKKAA